MSHSAIEVTDLKKTYRYGFLGSKKVEALKGVSFAVEPGEIVGLLGPNGAGKTTVIKVLLGIVRRTAGDAQLLGEPAGARVSRKQVGFLPEHLRFPRHHTGTTALHYYASLSGMSNAEIRRRSDELLELVGLRDRGGLSVTRYSKGMLQRLGLAQAMMHDPQLLILDEPTDGVDPVGRKDMRVMLERLQEQGKTILINSHLLQEVELICDRVVILAQGLVRRKGSIEELTETAGEYQITVAGATEPQLREALNGYKFQIQTATPPFQVTAELADQAAVDRCVDALRAAGISIVGMQSTRLTLEQAFLQTIGPQGPPT